MRTPPRAGQDCGAVLAMRGGTLLPLRYYFWGIALGAGLLWALISGHLAWHKADYVCTGKYVYTKPTEWYVKAKLGSVEWRSNNAVYDCPINEQVPSTKADPARSLDTTTLPPGALN